MQSLFTTRAESAKQRKFVLLAFVVLLWTWSMASHVHAEDEHASSGASHTCICHIASAAAPPPVAATAQEPLAIVIGVVSAAADAIATPYFAASYSSRAPPAR